jgi:O-antigen ligase
MRTADGLYRAKATFSTPLGLAEYMALCTPFFIQFATGRYHWLFRIFSAAMIPVAFYCVQASGSRLGNVGMLISLVLYLFFWGALRWRHMRNDLIGPAIVIGYPAFAAGILFLSLFWRRLHVMLLGGGAQQASNEARTRQIEMALPKIVQNPFGHGAAQAGDSMGYAADKFAALDNHYLLIGLSYGVLGLIAFYGMIIAAMIYAMRDMYRTNVLRDRESTLLMPITVCFAAFLVIKWVFSQEDNHSIIFMMLGMVSALVWRHARAAVQPTIEEAAEILRPALKAVLRPSREREWV